MSFFGTPGTHWYPCFGFLVTPPLGCKARTGSALFAFICGSECNVHALLVASMQPVTSPHAYTEVGLGLRFEQTSTQTKDKHTTLFTLIQLNLTLLSFMQLDRT